MNIINIFIDNARKYPEKTAIIYESQSLTYSRLETEVKQLSALFENIGVKQKDSMIVMLNNSIEFVITMLAAANLGIVLVPLNTTLKDKAIIKSINITRAKFFIANAYILNQIDQDNLGISSKSIISVGENSKGFVDYNSKFSINVFDYELDKFKVDSSEKYIYTMTSGSTGSPKPIIFTQEIKIKRAFLSARDLYKLNSSDVIIASSPMYHSLAQRLTLLPLLIGGTLALIKKFTPKSWLLEVEKSKVTFAILVSSQLDPILNQLKKDTSDISTLKTIVSSSSLLNIELKKKCLKMFDADFHEIYGASEVGTVTNLYPKDTSKTDSVGKALPYVDLRIVNDEKVEVDRGTIGEIVCSTPTLFSGYLNNATEDNASIIENFFYTGDLGYLDEDGFLYFSGRKKDVIIVGGINVYPKDIEDVINSHKSVKECAVLGVEDDYFGEIILAVISVIDENLDIRELKRMCINNLADFQQPMVYEVMNEIPKNSMGKIVKYRIKTSFENGNLFSHALNSS